MSLTINYNRPKAVIFEVVPIDFTLYLSELNNSPALGSGVTADLDSYLEVDFSGWKQLFHITAIKQMDISGIVTITIVVIPIQGNGSTGIPKVFSYIHDQNMDTFQTQAGFPRN